MDEPGDQVDARIYVAVPERLTDGKYTLSWVLNYFPNTFEIILTHVHVPAQMIPMMGTMFPASQSSPFEVNSYRQEQRNKTEKHLNEYLQHCSKAKFKAEKLIFESDDVAQGLVELIGLHGISYLVMGAASDRKYSRGVTELRSSTAKNVMEKAHPSCKIAFICKGTLVYTREPAVPPPQTLNHTASMRTERDGRFANTRSFDALNLYGDGLIPGFPPSPSQPSRMNSHNNSVDFSGRATRSDATSSIASEEGYSNCDLLSLNDFDARSFQEHCLEPQVSMPAPEQGNIADICAKLQAAIESAANYRAELNKEICKREKVEMDLVSLIQKAEETKNIILKEKQVMEFLHKQEIEMVTRRLYLLQEENNRLQETIRKVKELRDGADCGSRITFSEISLLEIQQATDNFNNSYKIGEGGFGCVYKGFLRNTMVAIKMLHPQSLQGRSEFEQEVAILSTMRHPNLVTLIGTCSEKSAIVYELLPNGSLEDRLACQGGTNPLTWQVRTRIIGEICRALLFLHSSKPNAIVHGDLTPASILLDANLVSKLSDFGISRLQIKSNRNTLVYRTQCPKGTLNYIDPEFLTTNEITVKSDVYSFGIIVLRLLTGRPPTNIAAEVEDAIETGSLDLLIDTSAGQWPSVQAEQLVKLGLRCAQLQRKRRPDLESEWKLVESLMKAASLFVLPSFKLQLDNKGTPNYFLCPILKEVMKDPHIAADGYTYEAEAIKNWLDGGNATSPMTNLPLPHLELTPNNALRSTIQEWLLSVTHTLKS